MSVFPRTNVGGISVSRMIIGTNWFLGYTHCTRAKSVSTDRMVTNVDSIADIIEAFFQSGVDTITGSTISTKAVIKIINAALEDVGPAVEAYVAEESKR